MSAKEITDAIRFPEKYDNGEGWSRGLLTNQPYGVGNASLFDAQRLKKANELGMIAWRSGQDTGNEVVIPTGCGSYLLSGNDIMYTALNCGDGEWPIQKL